MAYLSAHNKGIKDAATLQQSLDRWVEKYADKRRYDGKTVEELFEVERSHLTLNPDISTYMAIASTSRLSSLNAEIEVFGYRIALPSSYANRLLTVVVRHNGQYRVSTAEGLEVKSGTIPIPYLHKYSINSRVDRSSSEMPSEAKTLFDPMSDLEGLDI